MREEGRRGVVGREGRVREAEWGRGTLVGVVAVDMVSLDLDMTDCRGLERCGCGEVFDERFVGAIGYKHEA